MSQYNIPESFSIPYYDHDKSLLKTIRNSSKRRKMNFFYFTFRKIRNIILYRWAYFCPLNSWRIRFHRWRGVHIGKNVYIGIQCSIDNAYPEMVFIEDDVSIVQGTTIVAHTTAPDCFNGIIQRKVAPVHIKHHAMVSINATILPGVKIGEYAIIGACSLVQKDVPAFTMFSSIGQKKEVNFKHMINHFE
ncbi:MAG: acyltransferase [Bacteroidales bacterium]